MVRRAGYVSHAFGRAVRSGGLALVLGLTATACDGKSAEAPTAHAQSSASPAQGRGGSAASALEAPLGPAAQAAPKAQQAVAQLGKPAPDFTLQDTDGKTHKLSALRGKTVVLEWFNPDCPFVKHAHGKGPLVDMARKHQSASLVWLSINSSAPGKQGHGKERNVSAKSEYRMDNPVLLDEDGRVGRAYGAQKTPHMFVVNPEGVLVYRGGLDNAPMGVVDDERPRPEGSRPGELVAYVENALADLKAKRPVSLADTPAYGCTVKYAD